jgi:uncharacterized protein (TIGR03435 family)
MNQDRFEIIATPDGPIGEALNGPPLRLLSMVRALLADRFRLQLRRESRQMPIDELIIDRADGRLGSSLRTTDGQCVSMLSTSGPITDFGRLCGFRNLSPNTFSGRGLTIGELAGGLSFRPEVQRVVRDLTGLEGKCDADLQYTALIPPAMWSVGPLACGL